MPLGVVLQLIQIIDITKPTHILQSRNDAKGQAHAVLAGGIRIAVLRGREEGWMSTHRRNLRREAIVSRSSERVPVECRCAQPGPTLDT
jgi:hypothetical protein